MPKPPLSMSINAKELEEFERAFPGAMDRMIELTALELLKHIGKEAPKKTGALAGSWQVAHMGKNSYGLSSRMPYRWFVQRGTPPHTIEAKGSALYFYWDKVGSYVFFKRVHHPGTKPNPYVTRAIEATSKRVGELAQTVIQEIMP